MYIYIYIYIYIINCAPYLNDPRISQREAKLLFRLRTIMYHMKANYKGMHLNNVICSIYIVYMYHALQGIYVYVPRRNVVIFSYMYIYIYIYIFE